MSGARAALERLLVPVRRHRTLIWTVVALSCAGAAGIILARQDWATILATVRATRPGLLLRVSLLVALSFLALSGYDFIAIRLAGHRIPGVGLVLKTSFVGTVLAMNFGFTMLSGGAVRAWYYGRAGIPPRGIALIIANMAVTFFLGWLGLLGATLAFWPAQTLEAGLGLSIPLQRAGGILLLCLLAGYIVASAAGVRLRLGHLAWKMPSPGLALLQIGVSLTDACLAGLVVHQLLPAPPPPFLPFMGAFLTAVFLGLASHVPGGLGVIEVTLMHLLPGPADSTSFLASMVLYRLLNFVAPLALAGVIILFDWPRRRDGPA